MELDLPTGTGSSNNNTGDHLGKFLGTLTELVALLAKAGPGGNTGGSSGSSPGGAADTSGNKNLVKATQKLFSDLANAFKPLKNVLSKFGSIQPTAAKAKPEATPTALQAPVAEQAEETAPKRKGRRKKADATGDEQAPISAITPPLTPEPTPKAPKGKAKDQPTPISAITPPLTPEPTPKAPKGKAKDQPTPISAITIQDASIGIDFASVKMPAAIKAPKAAEPKPEAKGDMPVLVQVMDVDTNLVKITVPTASIKIASGLMMGKFFLPPDFAAKSAPKTKAETDTSPKAKADADTEKPKQEKAEKAEKASKTQAEEKPKAAQKQDAPALLTWGNVFKRLIGGADERKNKGAAKAVAEQDNAATDDTQTKNNQSKKAAQDLQSAIINIANGVVNVTTGAEKKDDDKKGDEKDSKKDDEKKPTGNSPVKSPKGKTGALVSAAKAGPQPVAAPAGGGPKLMAGGGGPKMGGPKIVDPRAMLLLAVAKVVTSLKDGAVALGQAAIAAAHKVVDAAQKGAQLVGSGVAAPFKVMSQKMFGGSEMLTKAFTDPIGAFKDLSGMIISFVQLANPAAVMQFSKAMMDVTAIVGRALVPAMNVATEVVRELGDVLAPLYESLMPTITMISRAFGDLFISMIRVAVMYAQVFLPISKSLYIVLAGLARIVAAVLEGFTVLLAGFLGTFDGMDAMVQSAVDAIVDFTQWIVKAGIKLAVLVAQFFGASQFVANMLKVAKNKGATDRTDSTGMAAPTGGQMQSAESFGKNIAQASFTATTAGSAPKKSDDFLADIATDIEAMSQVDFKQVIIDALVAAGPALGAAIFNATKTAAKETVKKVGEVAYNANPLRVPGEALGNFIGKLIYG